MAVKAGLPLMRRGDQEKCLTGSIPSGTSEKTLHIELGTGKGGVVFWGARCNVRAAANGYWGRKKRQLISPQNN